MTTLDARPRRGVTLTETGAEFWRHPSPWMIAALLAAAVATRVLIGDWQLSDLWAPAAFRKHGVYLSARDLDAA